VIDRRYRYRERTFSRRNAVHNMGERTAAYLSNDYYVERERFVVRSARARFVLCGDRGARIRRKYSRDVCYGRIRFGKTPFPNIVGFVLRPICIISDRVSRASFGS